MSAGLAAGAGKIQIAVFYYNPSPYGVASYKAASSRRRSSASSVTVFDGNNVRRRRPRRWTDAITTGKYKAFWVWALDGVSLAPTIKQAEAKGIKVAVADYTLGDLNSQLTLSPTKGLVSTIGGSIGKQEQAFVKLIKQACTKQVGADRHVQRRVHAWSGQLPDRHAARELHAGDVRRYEHQLHAHAARSVRPADVTGGRADVLPVEAEHPGLRLVRRSDDRRRDDRVQAAGDHSGQGPPGARLRRHQSRPSPQIKAGTVFGTVALYPCTESYIGIKDLVAAIKGKKIPSTVNVIDKNHPLIITQATLKTAKGFKPDWSLTGAPG